MAHRRSNFVTTLRRKTGWIAPADQGYVSVASGGATLVQSFDPAAAGLPAPTIVRTRGQLSVKPQSFAADVAIIGAWGIAVVSDQAFGIGITAIPKPFINADWGGWFAWGSFSHRLEFQDATGMIFGPPPVEVDSKGMRKVTDNETIVMIAESQAGALDISMPLRMLLKFS